MMRRIVFELVGLPASGKTTILNHFPESIIKKVTTEDYYGLQHSYGKHVLVFRMIKYCVNNVGEFFLLMAHLPCYRIRNTIELMFYLCNYDHYLKKYPSEVYLFDQGIIQFIWSTYWDEKIVMQPNKRLSGFGKIASYFENKYNLIPIIVRADYLVAADRANKRNSDCYVDHLGMENIVSLYKALDEEIESIQVCFKNSVNFTNINLLYDKIMMVLKSNQI